MEDHQIVSLYWSRSEQAIQETAAKYGGYCHSIAFRILDSSEDSEECVNDTYWKAWNAIPPHCPKNLATFLGKITRNLAIDRYHQRSAQKRGGGETQLVLDELRTVLPGNGQPEEIADELALAETLNRFLAALQPIPRKIFMLRYWHACSVKGIARHLGMSESRVKMSLLRSRSRLKEILDEEEIGL